MLLSPRLLLLAIQQANKLRGEMLGQGIETLFSNPADWEDGRLVSPKHQLIRVLGPVSFIE